MDDFSLARPAGHLIMGDGSGPDGLAKKDGAKALSGAESVDTATTQLDKPSRTKNLIIEILGPWPSMCVCNSSRYSACRWPISRSVVWYPSACRSILHVICDVMTVDGRSNCIWRPRVVQTCVSPCFAPLYVHRPSLVDMVMWKRRRGSPLGTRSAPKHAGEPQLFRQCFCATNSDTLSDKRCVPLRPINASRRRRRPAAGGR